MKIEKNNTPLVSILVCVFNRKNLIERALNSILSQSFKNYEVIIVDDGSNDGVEEVIFPYLKKYNNFKYIRHSNRNLPLSKNTGILLAQGKYLTFLDSDDEYTGEHMQKMVTFMENNPDYDLVHSSPRIVGDKEDFWVIDARDETKLININDCAVGPTFFGKREVFTKLNGFNDLFWGDDFNFFDRLIDSDIFKSCKLFEKTYVYYRNIEESMTNSAKKSYQLKNRS